MSTIEIIGISGKAGSGKDYVGRTVLRPAGYLQWAFAWHMKNEGVGAGYTWEGMHLRKNTEERRWLQQRGTEDGWKKHGRRYWVDITEAWLRTLEVNDWPVSKVYLTDVRFPHEAEWVRERGGKLVRLEHGDRPYPLAGTPEAEHESETALDDYRGWDAIIVNSLDVTPEMIRGWLEVEGVLPSRPRLRRATGESQLSLSLGG